MKSQKELKFAILIDADNITYRNIVGIMEELAKFGVPIIKRVYGDWTSASLSGWKSVALENSLTPMQQYSYTFGKNSTDSALIIDAMDMLHTNDSIDGFCIVSSDSDFTKLASRLRESGKKVIGMGAMKTPKPFITACDKFIYIEIINQNTKNDKSPENITTNEIKANENKANEKVIYKVDKELIRFIENTIRDIDDEDGFADLSALGGMLIKRRPDFDQRNYGFSKLSRLLDSIDTLEIKDDVNNGGKKSLKVRLIGIK